jgi:exodeoxyribonuclease-3
MRLVSWNVNGIRAAVGKYFLESLADMNPDVICLQETKAQDDQVLEALSDLPNDYQTLSYCAEKKGYSGTAIITRIPPISVTRGIGHEEHDQEGRVLCCEFADFYLVTVYTPNSGSELKRLDYRTEWDAAFLDYVRQLQNSKPVVICGDLNVAHRDIDLARPKPNYNKSAGYMQAEIDGIDALLAADFVDTFRHLHPSEQKYSWWSYRAGAREKNIGWRIDYFLVSSRLVDQLSRAHIYTDVYGSDHCPVGIELSI